jgi:hypothetical protein
MTEPREARIQALKDEIDAIFQADTLYWKAGEINDANARAEYQRRQDRLEEIRKELDRLQSP